MTTDAFVDIVAEADNALSEAADRSLPKNDPFRALIAAFRTVLGVLPSFMDRVEKTVDRSPLTPAQLEEMQRMVAKSAENGVRKEVARLSRGIDRRSAAAVGIIVAVVGLGCLGCGYVAGRQSISHDVAAAGQVLELEAAKGWADLIRANPDPRPSLAAAQSWVDQPSQRRAAALPLFLDPPKAGAPGRR